MSCHVESCVVSCHIVPCCVLSCCFMCVVSCHVEGWSRHVVSCHVAFCHVLSCPCGGPQKACVRKLLLPKDHVSHTARTVIRLRTARPPRIFSSSRCFKKKRASPRLSLRQDSSDPEGSNEQRPGARSKQADVRVYHHETAVWAVRVLVLPVKKNVFCTSWAGTDQKETHGKVRLCGKSPNVG